MSFWRLHLWGAFAAQCVLLKSTALSQWCGGHEGRFKVVRSGPATRRESGTKEGHALVPKRFSVEGRPLYVVWRPIEIAVPCGRPPSDGPTAETALQPFLMMSGSVSKLTHGNAAIRLIEYVTAYRKSWTREQPQLHACYN